MRTPVQVHQHRVFFSQTVGFLSELVEVVFQHRHIVVFRRPGYLSLKAPLFDLGFRRRQREFCQVRTA